MTDHDEPAHKKLCRVCTKCGGKNPRYGQSGAPATHCAGCKTEDMVDVTSKKCEACNKRRPSFGQPGGRPTHCAGCMTEDMVDVTNKMCEGCNKTQPSFGPPGGRPTHCAGCKTEGMVNVVSKMCEACNKKTPSFGPPGGRPTHCAGCKTEGMVVDVTNKKCEACNKRRPSFGQPGGRPTHCAGCMTEDMVDVTNKMCEGCNKTQPSFGPPGGRPTHCAGCKTEGMVNVVSKMCEGCNKKIPIYGQQGGRPTHCGDCKTEDMVDVTNKKCEACNKTQPCFGHPGGRPTHCAGCKTEGMVNVVTSRCEHNQHAWEPEHERPFAKASFDGARLCSTCLLHAMGASGATLCRAVRREHIALGQLVTQTLPHALGLSPHDFMEYYHDLAVRACQTIARPDLRFVLPKLLVVIEFDENNHSDRSELSETKHLQVIRDWNSEENALDHVYVLRINERGLFTRSATGAATGDAHQPREWVWMPTDRFLPVISKAAERLLPWFHWGLGTAALPPECIDTNTGVLVEWV